MDLLFSKIREDQKEAIVAELQAARTKEERLEVLKKYNVSLTEEEKKAVRGNAGFEIPDNELEEASGGCGSCNCGCSCNG